MTAPGVVVSERVRDFASRRRNRCTLPLLDFAAAALIPKPCIHFGEEAYTWRVWVMQEFWY